MGTQAGRGKAQVDLSPISVGKMPMISCDLDEAFTDNLDVI
jgi:hypothetical protein